MRRSGSETQDVRGAVCLPPAAAGRNSRSTSCSLFERVKGSCEERFEERYGFWRGLVDGVVARYLDCGIPDRGFARTRCPECRKELLLAPSARVAVCRPCCRAKRAAAFAAFLRDEVIADVGHAQWVFTVPKILRP
jgi:hypothetical protein